MKQLPTDQCIVLPLRPRSQKEFNGMGLALHFLMGNILVLHTHFKEMWFGWRVKKIFPTQTSLQQYCRDTGEALNLQQTARSQKIRYWIHGVFTNEVTELTCYDEQCTEGGAKNTVRLPISANDDLIGFRKKFIDWLSTLDLPMPKDQINAALWPEKIDIEGLDAVGRCLENLYLYSYRGEGPLDMESFKKAVKRAPKSFMALDLYGWAFYRNRDYRAAHDAFLASLAINPAGAGAMSGLMWCGVYNKDLEEALFWSGRKADVCGRDVEAARAAGRRRYEKANNSKKKD